MARGIRISDLSSQDTISDAALFIITNQSNRSRSISYATLVNSLNASLNLDDIIENLLPYQIPMKSADGTELVYGGATVNPTTGQWTFDKSIILPSGSLKISDTLSISEATRNTLVEDTVSGTVSADVCSAQNTSGTVAPAILETSSEVDALIQPDDSIPISVNPLSFTIIPVEDNQTNKIYLRTFAGMTNVRITLRDVTSGVVLKYIPTREAVTTGTGGLDFVAGENTIDLFSNAIDTVGVFNLGISPLRILTGETLTALIEADFVALNGNAFNVPYIRAAQQIWSSTQIAYIRDTSNIADPYIRLNNEYDTAAGVSTGIVANYERIPGGTTITNGQFTAGVAATSNPTVETDGIAVYSAGEIIQIKGTQQNDGFFEVESHIGSTLTIRGVGVTPTTDNFVRDNFVTQLHGTPSAFSDPINVGVLRFNASGDVESGKGASLPIVYTPIAGSGDVMGPGSSVDNRIVTWDGPTGDLIQDITTITAENGIMIIGEDANNIARLHFENDVGADKLVFEFNDVAAADQINISSTVATVWSATDNFTVDTAANNLLLGTSSSSALLLPSGDINFTSAHNNLTPAYSFEQTGTSTVSSSLLVTPTDLVAEIGSKGDFAISIPTDPTPTRMWLQTTTGATYAQVLTTDDTGSFGDVTGPASSVDNRIVTYNSVTGKLIQDNTTITADAGNLTITEDAGNVARLTLENDVGTDKLIIAFNDVAGFNEVDITSSVPVNWNANSAFNLTTTTDQILLDNGTASLAITPAAQVILSSTEDHLNPGFSFSQTGTGGTSFDILASNLNLDSQGGNQGTFAISTFGGTSFAFLKQSVGGTYERILTTLDTTGDVTAGTVVTNGITNWTGSGNEISGSNNFTHELSGQINIVALRSGGAAGEGLYRLLDSSGGAKADWLYNETSDRVELEAIVGVPMDIITTNQPLLLRADSAQLQLTSGTGITVTQGANNSAWELVTTDPNGSLSRDNGDVAYLIDGIDSDLKINVSTATGTNWASLRGIAVASMGRQPTDGLFTQIIDSFGLDFQGFAAVYETTAGVLSGNLSVGPDGQFLRVDQVFDTTNGDLYRVNFTAGMAAGTNTIIEITFVTLANGAGTFDQDQPATKVIFGGSNFPIPISLSGVMRGPNTTSGNSGIQIFMRKSSGSTTIYSSRAHMSIERIGG